jgi:hypothetical protein
MHLSLKGLPNTFEQEQLNQLSTSLRFVCGGVGSFNDYVPHQFTWDIDTFSNHFWESALALKVVGKC